MAGTMNLEVHVRRNFESRTRAQAFHWEPLNAASFALQPGSDPNANGQVIVDISAGVPITEKWLSVIATLRINGIMMADPRPGVIFLEMTDIPTLIHFPSLARPHDKVFGGWWTVCLRVVP